MNQANETSDVQGAEAEAMVRFTTQLSDRDVTPLLSHLVGGGEAIAQFREVPTDLEDAFLSVAGSGDSAVAATEPADAAASQPSTTVGN
jgi:ABC-2 type transport system ATP-binding protein